MSTGFFTCTFFIIAYGVTQLYIYCIIVYYTLCAQLFSLCNLMDRSPPAPLSMGIVQARIPEWVAMPSFRGFSWHRDRPWVSCVASNLPLPSEPPGKPKNPGVGCHALLQGIFPTQGSNPGLLPCRWILYHLSHQKPTASIHTWMQPLCMFVCGERACDEDAMEDVGKELARPDQPQFDPKLWKEPKSIPSKSREFLEKTELLVLRPEEIQQWCVKTF